MTPGSDFTARLVDALERRAIARRPHHAAVHHAGRPHVLHKAAPPVTLAGMSMRSIDWPTILWLAGSFGFDLGGGLALEVDAACDLAIGDLAAVGGADRRRRRPSAYRPQRRASAPRRSTSIARTSAPAMRSAVPLFSTDWLPAVWPSLGVRPVSPEIMRDAGERQVELLGGDLLRAR